MKSKKDFLALIITIAIAIVGLTGVMVFANEVIVEIDGQRVSFDGQGPVIISGRTLVPVRGVFEQLGYSVNWDEEFQAVYLTGPGEAASRDNIRLVIGHYEFNTNGEQLTLDVPPQIINGSTMLPLRAVLESVGIGLDWDGARSAVIISTQPTETLEGSFVSWLFNVTAVADAFGYIFNADGTNFSDFFGFAGNGVHIVQDDRVYVLSLQALTYLQENEEPLYQLNFIELVRLDSGLNMYHWLDDPWLGESWPAGRYSDFWRPAPGEHFDWHDNSHIDVDLMVEGLLLEAQQTYGQWHIPQERLANYLQRLIAGEIEADDIRAQLSSEGLDIIWAGSQD